VVTAVPYSFPKSKDPDDVADYHLDWSLFIGKEKLVSKTLLVTGATLVSSALDSKSKGVNFRVSGGIAGTPALIDCTVTTDSAQVFQANINLKIGQR
jgi:hypothetical protein